METSVDCFYVVNVTLQNWELFKNAEATVYVYEGL